MQHTLSSDVLHIIFNYIDIDINSIRVVKTVNRMINSLLDDFF